MGGSPKDAVVKIEDVLEIKPNRKDYLGESANTLGSIPHASDGCSPSLM